MRTSFINTQDHPFVQRHWFAQRAISERITAALRRGRTFWQTPIRRDNNCGMPLNVSTGKSFTPINTLLLQGAAEQHGFAGRWWGTETDWLRVGGSVASNAEPTMLFDDQAYEFAVFNVEQVRGFIPYSSADTDVIDAEHADYTAVQSAIAATGADIRVGVGDERYLETQTMYICPDPWSDWPNHQKGDYILIPSKEWAFNHASYVYSHLHELVHWAEVRTGWMSQMHQRELVAEIGSAWLATALGCPPCQNRENHNKWIHAWLYWAKRDVRYVMEAAEQAERAVRCVMSYNARNQHGRKESACV